MLPNGKTIPRFSAGTWRMGACALTGQAQIAVIKAAIKRGVTLIDTAEMYCEDGAEKVIGQAVNSARERLHVVSKLYPDNATLKGTIAVRDRSRKRRRIDYVDCYLLHQPGEHREHKKGGALTVRW